MGTANPNAQLQIAGSSTLSEIRLTNSSTGHTTSDGLLFNMAGTLAQIIQKEDNDINFHINGTDVMRLKKNGYLGIGTNNPGLGIDSRVGNVQFQRLIVIMILIFVIDYLMLIVLGVLV